MHYIVLMKFLYTEVLFPVTGHHLEEAQSELQNTSTQYIVGSSVTF